MADARSDSAVGARNDIFAADDFRKSHEAIGDCLGMLDEVAVMSHDPWDKDFPVGSLNFSHTPPLMFVARIRCLNGIGSGAN